jgi:hypothetical protein
MGKIGRDWEGEEEGEGRRKLGDEVGGRKGRLGNSGRNGEEMGGRDGEGRELEGDHGEK